MSLLLATLAYVCIDIASSEKVDICHTIGQPGVFSLGHCLPIYGACDEYQRFSILTCPNFPANVIYENQCFPRHKTECPGILKYHYDHPRCQHHEDHIFSFHNCRSEYGICFSGCLFVAACPLGETFDAASGSCSPSACASSAHWTSALVVDDDLCWGRTEGAALRLGHCNPHYVVCENRVAIKHFCPQGEIFTKGNFCHTPEADECYDYEKGRLGSSESERSVSRRVRALAELLEFCLENRDGIYVPREAACSPNALFCMAGKASVLDCPEGSVMDPDHGSCEYVSAQYCPAGSHPDQYQLEKYLANEKCTYLTTGKYLLETCESYYLDCDGEHSGVKLCPHGVVFVSHLGACEDVHHTNCHTVPQESHHNHGYGSIAQHHKLPCENVENGMLPSQSCSSHYYVCAGHQTLAATCAPGKAFLHDDIRICVFRHLHPQCPHEGRVQSGIVHEQFGSRYNGQTIETHFESVESGTHGNNFDHNHQGSSDGIQSVGHREIQAHQYQGATDVHGNPILSGHRTLYVHVAPYTNNGATDVHGNPISSGHLPHQEHNLLGSTDVHGNPTSTSYHAKESHFGATDIHGNPIASATSRRDLDNHFGATDVHGNTIATSHPDQDKHFGVTNIHGNPISTSGHHVESAIHVLPPIKPEQQHSESHLTHQRHEIPQGHTDGKVINLAEHPTQPYYAQNANVVVPLPAQSYLPTETYQEPDVYHQQRHRSGQASCYSGYKYPNPKDCASYLLCSSGQLITRLCPTSFGWDSEYGACSAHAPCAQKCDSAFSHGYAAAHNSCRQFKQCVHGVWAVRDCPAGTGWSQALLTCDHLRNLHCL